MGSHLHTCNCVSVRLDETNYATWVYLMFHHLRGHGLAKFVDDSHPCPSQFHVSGNESVSVDKSEAYERWEQQDSFVVSMITSTLSVDALTLVIGCETSLKVWSTLKQHYAPTSEFHISQLKSTMQNIRKGSETIDKYLLRFKSVRDDLAAAGFNMSDQDVMHYILAGLPVEYGPTRQLIWSKKEISMDEMRCLLLSGELEIKLKQYSSPLPSLADLYAAHNYACRRNSYLHGAAQSGVFTEASTLVKGTNKLQNSFASSDGDHKLKFVSSCNKDLQSSMPFGNAKTSDISFIAPLHCDFLSNSGLVTSATKSALVESNSTGKARSFSSMSSEYYGSTAAYESSVTDAEKFNPQENGSMPVHTSQANLHSPSGNGNSIQGDQGNTRMKRDIKSEISSTSASESSTIKNEARNQYPCPLSCFSRPQALSATMKSNSKSHSKITRPVSDASRSQPSHVKPLQLVSASSFSSPIHSALQQSFTILGALPTSNNKLHSNTKERSPKVCRQACESKNLRKSLPLIPPG